MNSPDKYALFKQPTICSTSYDGKIAGLYDLEETLGSGHFAVVKLARHVFTGAKVAVKVVDKTKLDEVSKAHLFQEVRCMKLVQHPNVVRLYEVIDTQTKLYLVLEFGDGGDLYDYIMKHEKGLNEDLARKYFRQIHRAITYCHKLHVVHRDLKPENVVFFEKLGIVKLTDFGFSNKFSPGQKLETFCGSLAYSAPEILLGDSYDAPAVDIWSLGVILYMLVCGQPPFEKANDSETLTMIMDCKYTVPSQVSQNCRRLIASMLVRDPQKRATLDQIAVDPWLKENPENDSHEHTPLVSQHQLSEEDQAFIIQKMINGKIATKEEIFQSLDKNNYNHITATYFLLAELKLRKYEDKNKEKVSIKSVESPDQVDKFSSQEKEINSEDNVQYLVPSTFVNEERSEKRNRKCSIVREEDEDEYMYENLGAMNTLKIAVSRRESISDGRINRSVQECSKKLSPVILRPCRKEVFKESLSQKSKQLDVKVSEKANKNLLIPKKIFVGDVSDNSKSIPIANVEERFKNLELENAIPFSNSSKNSVLTHRRIKLNKIRTPSCSSSEASDDDTKSKNKKKINKFVGDTPTRFRTYRRDSHDDSSDQDQTCPSSGSQTQTTTYLITTANTNVEEKKNNENQKRQNTKSDENRKNSNSQKYKKHTKEEHTVNQYYSTNQRIYSPSGKKQRARASQFLDRITESQEYDILRHQNSLLFAENHLQHKKTLFTLSFFTVADKNEESAQVSNLIQKKTGLDKNHLINIKNSMDSKSKLKTNCHLNSCEEFDLILEEKDFQKTIKRTGAKYFISIKRIRRLGKYIPGINFF